MAMKKKDKRLYDRIMHSKKKKRSQVNFFSAGFAFCFVVVVVVVDLNNITISDLL